MPGKLRKGSKYSPVNDTSDTRLPVHNDEAFKHGIHFDAKYIGTLEVARPSSRTEIVTAMRKIRLEFKMKKVKKRKIQIVVSTSGVKVLSSDSRKTRKSSSDLENDEFDVVMSHPIHKVFYVSHDSTDLQIFSYITKDPSTGTFSCSVFKAKKKDQAMYIVRTIGQAFEVCHKLALQAKEKQNVVNGSNTQQKATPKQELEMNIKEEEPKMNKPEEKASNDVANDVASAPKAPSEEKPVAEPVKKVASTVEQPKETASQSPVPPASPLPPGSPQVQQTQNQSSVAPQLQKDEMHNDDISFWAMEGGQENTSMIEDAPISSSHPVLPASAPLSLQYLQKVHEHQMNLQRQETQVAQAQVQLLKQQLESECALRRESQAQVETLIQQNRELIITMQQLVRQIHAHADMLTTPNTSQTIIAQKVMSATSSVLQAQLQTDSPVPGYGQQQLATAWSQAQNPPNSPARDNPVAASTPHKSAAGVPLYNNVSPFKSTGSIPQLPPPPKSSLTRKSSRSGSVTSSQSQNSSPVTGRSNPPPSSPHMKMAPANVDAVDGSVSQEQRRPLPDEFLQLAYNTSVTSPLPTVDDKEFDLLRKDNDSASAFNNVSSTSQSGAVTVCLLQGQQIIENNVAQSRNSVADALKAKPTSNVLNGNANVQSKLRDGAPPR